MYKLFDFQCPECKQIKEWFVDNVDDVMYCDLCFNNTGSEETMIRLISAPKGYVKDTINPVRYKS